MESEDRGNLFAMHPLIELRPTGTEVGGLGLYATGLIKEGETIWAQPREEFEHQVHTAEEIVTWEEEKRMTMLIYAFQVSRNQFAGPCTRPEVESDASNFMNHSCDPTTWYVSDSLMTARRDIQPGEEITFDYGTSQTYHWPSSIPEIGERVKCFCGADNCRGIITADDWKKPELQKTYGRHFLPYVLEMIDEYNS